MPAIDNIAVAATATPYKPLRAKDSRIATQTKSTGHMVDFIDTAMPAMMLVACPVVEAWATYWTGLYSVPV